MHRDFSDHTKQEFMRCFAEDWSSLRGKVHMHSNDTIDMFQVDTLGELLTGDQSDVKSIIQRESQP